MSNSNFKHVFVCGLHRSGTTALARDIGKFRDCTAFANTGVIMDEGQYLQDVYPLENDLGGAGKFGFSRHAHLTERSSLLTPANVSRLRNCWEPYWENGKTVRIEKTPRNLLMTRFLQAAFDNAYFVVIRRHPVAVSVATQKWSGTSLRSLFEHWLRCHRIFDGDKPHLRRLYELRYEDYVQNPVRYLSEIAAFIGTEPSSSPQNEAEGSYNEKYFTQWKEMMGGSARRPYYRSIARLYESRFRAYGYSLYEPLGDAAISPGEGAFMHRAVDLLFCHAVEAYTFSRRRWGWPGSRTVHLMRRAWTAFGRPGSSNNLGAPAD